MAKRSKAAGGKAVGGRPLTGRDLVLVGALNLAVGWLLKAESPGTFDVWLDIAMLLLALGAGCGLLARLAVVPPRQPDPFDETADLALPAPE